MVITIETKGMNEVQASLRRTISAAPDEARRVNEEAATAGYKAAREAAPVETGALKGSITTHFTATTARYAARRHYGLYLDKPVTRKPHYRSGPRRGQPTAGWFSDTRDVVIEKLNRDIIPAAVRRIEALWRR